MTENKEVTCHKCAAPFVTVNQDALVKCPFGHTTYVRRAVILDEIRLTPEQEELMVMMIHDVRDAPTAMKAAVRYQKWTKLIWDQAVKASSWNQRDAALQEAKDCLNHMINRQENRFGPTGENLKGLRQAWGLIHELKDKK